MIGAGSEGCPSRSSARRELILDFPIESHTTLVYLARTYVWYEINDWTTHVFLPSLYWPTSTWWIHILAFNHRQCLSKLSWPRFQRWELGCRTQWSLADASAKTAFTEHTLPRVVWIVSYVQVQHHLFPHLLLSTSTHHVLRNKYCVSLVVMNHRLPFRGP